MRITVTEGGKELADRVIWKGSLAVGAAPEIVVALLHNEDERNHSSSGASYGVAGCFRALFPAGSGRGALNLYPGWSGTASSGLNLRRYFEGYRRFRVRQEVSRRKNLKSTVNCFTNDVLMARASLLSLTVRPEPGV